VGIGKSINGGFGLVLDGSERVDGIIGMALPWDVMGGVARRSWARNGHAMEVCAEYNRERADLGHVTLPYTVDAGLLEAVFRDA
jgi:urocanate hydratase